MSISCRILCGLFFCAVAGCSGGESNVYKIIVARRAGLEPEAPKEILYSKGLPRREGDALVYVDVWFDREVPLLAKVDKVERVSGRVWVIGGSIGLRVSSTEPRMDGGRIHFTDVETGAARSEHALRDVAWKEIK